MKKVRHLKMKLISIILSVTMILAAIPMSASAFNAFKNTFTPDKTVSFATISDIHYYPKELTNNYCDAFMKSVKTALAREPYESVGILESALAALEAHAKDNGLKYVIIPGDLTSYSEYAANYQLSKRLEKFEKDSGLQVIVINGNHDVNLPNSATTYENGYAERARTTTPEEFKELYKNLGYDLAYHTYTPKTGKANMLSYSVKADGYRFIMMDMCKYSAEVTDSGKDIGETSGCMTPDFVNWVLDEIADAKAAGETVIGVNHHNLVPHYTGEYTIIKGFVVDGWEEITDRFADAGMHFSLTGHIHTSDISETVTDDGEKLTEICTDSLTAFPNYFREMKATTNADGKTEIKVNSYDVDCVMPVTVNSTTFSTPFRYESLGRSFYSQTGMSGLVKNFTDGFIEDYANKFVKNGINNTLKDMGIDIEGLIKGYFGDGLVIGSTELFTTKNLMSFINDLFSQIEDKYMTNPAATAKFLQDEIDKILEVKVSDLPNSRFYDEYGFGSKTQAGTLDDLLECVIFYMYEGNYMVEDDPFVMDAVNNLNNGDTIFNLFDTLVDVAANDILQDKLLSDLKLNVGTLFPDGSFASGFGSVLNVIFKIVFLGDTSYLNISNKVLGAANKLGVVDYSSLWGIVDHYMDEYLTPAQLQGVGQTLASDVMEFAHDNSCHEDGNTTLVYDGKVEVEATRDNYRLPTTLSVTFGADQSSRNVSWYTKSTVSGSDIQIIDANTLTVLRGFNGNSVSVPAGVTVNKSTERTTRQFPGVDFGVAGFMTYEFPMNRHIVSVSGLQAGKKYLYRVGDASRGWWSETGSFEIADGGTSTEFVHISDPQSQSAQQYKTFSSVIEKAYSYYPDSAFIVNTGDCVDHGDNFRQWKWFLDESSSTLMNTVMMAASGNHEEKGTNATVKNFAYSNLPQQDTTSGVYFSYDYNNVHVAVLNTNDLDKDNSLNDTQVEWLINDMKSSDADWKFVALHKAPYSNGSHYKDKDVCKIRDELSVLMPQLGIDMVFEGHDHVYLRTDSMINNQVESVTTSTATFNNKEYTVKQNPVGTVYVISGCSGVKVYKQKDASLTDEYFPRAEAIQNVEYPAFSGVRIVDDTLYFDAYTVNPDTGDTQNIDSFAIQKDLTVKKGTGVPEQSFDWSQLFTQMIEIMLPIFKQLAQQIFGFLSSKVF